MLSPSLHAAMLLTFRQVELEASTAPGPDASEAERQQHRMANLVRGLVDRKVRKNATAFIVGWPFHWLIL